MLTVHKPFGLASVLAAVLASSRVSPQIVVPLKLNPPAPVRFRSFKWQMSGHSERERPGVLCGE